MPISPLYAVDVECFTADTEGSGIDVSGSPPECFGRCLIFREDRSTSHASHYTVLVQASGVMSDYHAISEETE